MTPQTLWVPFSILNNTAHSASTRLVWWLLGRQSSGNLSPRTDIRLHRLSGLDLKTIAAARARLNQAPLAHCYVSPQRSCAAIPWSLLTSANISAGARLLYGQLQGLPGFEHQGGSFTYVALSRITGSSGGALRPAVAELVGSGWLTITRANRKHPCASASAIRSRPA